MDNTSILYGGSCNASNAKELFPIPMSMADLLAVSLGVDKFMPIIEAFKLINQNFYKSHKGLWCFVHLCGRVW